MRDELSGPLTLNLGVAKFEQETLSLVFSVRYPVTLKYELVYPRLSRGFTLGGFTETELTHAGGHLHAARKRTHPQTVQGI